MVGIHYPEQIERAAALNSGWRSRRETVSESDKKYRRPYNLAELGGVEAGEARVEAELEGTPLYSSEREADELGDNFVIITASGEASEQEIDYREAVERANGQSLSSNYWDELESVLYNLAEGNISLNLTYAVALIISRLNHLPEPQNIENVIKRVVSKNTANRPAVYYKAVDIDGKPLTRDESYEKYRHTERVNKQIIRKNYQTSMKPWQHLPHQEQILDFRNSDASFELMQKRLPMINAQIREEVFEHLVKPENAPMSQEELLEKLPVAGAILIPGVEYTLYQSQKSA